MILHTKSREAIGWLSCMFWWRARKILHIPNTVNPHLVAFILILKVLCLFLIRNGLFILFFIEHMFFVVIGPNFHSCLFFKEYSSENLFSGIFYGPLCQDFSRQNFHWEMLLLRNRFVIFRKTVFRNKDETL